MKHVVILFDEQDEQVAERLEKALALMQHKAELKTYSRLHILPGQNVEQEIREQSEKSEVSIVVLSIDLNQDVIFNLIERHRKGETDLFIVYANYVDEELINEFTRHRIPVTPIMPIAQYQNQDFAYQKITRAIRRHIAEGSTQPKQQKTLKRKLLILLAARRKINNG